MNIKIGDLVQVNAAAFIGSWSRNSEAIPCEVLEVESGRVRVRTQSPYRVFTMWVGREWVEDAATLLDA